MLKPLRPNQERFKYAQILIYMMLILELVLIFSELLQYLLLQEVFEGSFVSDERLEQNDLRQLIVVVLYVVIYVISGITFIQWFRRAYYNLSQNIKTEYTNGWAAGGWFVPIISLFYPYKIMKELYEKTNAIIKSSTSSNIDNVSIKTIGIWWAFWILTNVTGRIISKLPEAETVEILINHTLISIANDFLGVVLAFLVLKVMGDYNDLEKKYHKVVKQQNNLSTTDTIFIS